MRAEYTLEANSRKIDGKDGKTFISTVARLHSGEWVKVKFAQDCEKPEIKKPGMYYITFPLDGVNIQAGQPYTDKKGVDRIGNKTVWIHEYTSIKPIPDEVIRERRAAAAASTFGVADDTSTPDDIRF